MRLSLSKMMVLVTVITMDLLTGMEFDLFVPSFPELQSHFHLSPSWVESLLSANFIGYCLSLIFLGDLSDRYGRKPIILLGLVTFVIGSYVTLYFHWQGNFVVLLMMGLVVLMMALLFIPSSTVAQHSEAVSMRGLRGYAVLFKSGPLMLLMANLLFLFVPYWIFVGMSPLLYMKDLGVSLSHFGYYQGVLALVFALGSIIFGLIIKNIHYEHKNILRLAICILMVSLLIISIVTWLDKPGPLLITLAFLPFIIGQIIPSNILYPLCLNFMPNAKARVSAIIQGGRLILTSIGLQIAGFFYLGSFQNIGIILTGFILIGVITLFFVINNQKLMETV